MKQLSGYVLSTLEGSTPMKQVVVHSEYERLGAADAAILSYITRRPKTCLLTVDFDLYFSATSLGLRALNFNHVREARSDFHG
jgi:hypothetical protein